MMKLDKQSPASGAVFLGTADLFFSSPPLIIHFPFISVFLHHPLPPTRALSLSAHPSLVKLSPSCTRSVPIKADSPSAACLANSSRRKR